MLKVKTIVKESNIENAGLGLFADEDIKQGQIVWQMDKLDIKIKEEQYQKLSKIQKEFFDIYAYKEEDFYIICTDNGRFINHSEQPNCIDNYGSDVTIAKHFIKKGTELTCNYNSFCDRGFNK